MLFAMLAMTMDAYMIKFSSILKSTNTRAVSNTKLNSHFDSSLLLSILRRVDPAEAQGEFYFFFFGGSGALGIGFAQVPKVLKEYSDLKERLNSPTLGGEDYKSNPISTFGLPAPLKVKDIEYIIANLPTVDQISKKGKKETYMAKVGYLERQAFDDCFPNANRLALYAAFEGLSAGAGSFMAPNEYLERSTAWKKDGIAGFEADLFKSSAKKLSAYSVFAFLIFLVLDLIVESGVNAFVN